MLLKQNLSLYRILKITWQIDLLMIASCTAAYYVDTLVLKNWHLPGTFPALMGTAIAFLSASVIMKHTAAGGRRGLSGADW
ncbi:hypothetical protein MKQ70_21680 [Chitinophaga sedimenti]|uniref:hypothetical protein n=1 Tax=Chitinophaga sedimenti TaxID=2033606 RepID=UPI0020069D82|nr:hypothetical protein [Chitinophaga sedimenti]MCK7557474.1 hypothetical protein [Chitinophaga sedimenti]